MRGTYHLLSQMQYRRDLDGLRAVAVILVLCFHATFPLPGAFLGVDVFFTLSGYLITTIITASLLQGTFSLSSFYIKRSLRLLPAAVTVITITALVALALLSLNEARQTLFSAIAANASASNIRYLLQSGYFDSDSIAKPLLHTWSLAVEEQFYLIWPLLLMLFHRHFHPRAPLFFAVTIVSVSPYISHLLIKKNPSAAFYIAPVRFYELLLGAALSYIPPPSNMLLSQVLGISGSVGLVFSTCLISPADEFPSWRALIPCLSTAFLIHAGPESFVSAVLSLRPLVFVGKISYSVYLVHWPIIVFYRLLVDQKDQLRLGEQLFVLGAAFLLGLPLNLLIERRYRVSSKTTTVSSTVLQSPERHSNEAKCADSRRNCCMLFFWIASVQIFLLLCANFIEDFKRYMAAPMIPEKALPALGTESTSNDDFNSLNISSIYRLNTESSAARCGRIENPYLPPVVKRGYYENGSVPSETRPGEPTPGMPRILFIGDSHAWHMRSLAYHISKEFHVYVQVSNAPNCVFLLGVYNLFLVEKHKTKWCREVNKIRKEQISAEKFDTIVVCGRWAWHVEPDMYGKRELKDLGHLLFNESAPSETWRLSKNRRDWPVQKEESRRMFRKSIQETVKFLAGTGARVVLMGQVPMLRSNVRGCTSHPASQKAIATGIQPDRCVDVTREQVLLRMRYVREVFEEVRQMYRNNVTTIHPTDVFCDNYLQDKERCRVLLTNSLLYMDKSHINGLGGSFLALRLQALGYGGIQWNYRASPKK